jgi:hypothetical protein
MAWYWNAYRNGADASLPELSPLSATAITADVPVRIVDCHGMIHGFLRWTGEVPAARRWIDVIAAAARGMTADSPALAP